MEPGQNSARTNTLLYIALGAAIFAIAALSLLLVVRYRALEEEHLLGSRSSLLTTLRDRGTITPQDSAFIEAWMTFDYINNIFSLPPSYLQQKLSISDPRYPRVAIEEYAEDAHLDEATTLNAIRSAVESYAPAQ